MDAVLDWFATIGEYITLFIDYFIGFLEDTISLFIMLGNTAIVLPKVLFVLVPTPAVIIGGTVLVIAIFYKVTGREG